MTRTEPRAGCADAELLSRWCDGGDRTALETLIRRHGGMVYGVCHRVLGNHADADDAFQATFLVFVRRANSLDRPEQVAGWLHAVSARVARKARATRHRRHERETTTVDIAAHPNPTNPWESDPRRQALDEEIARLPDRYRLPIVLCELEGYTLEEAAHALGWPKGTVAGRLSRGRERLRERLVRRGPGAPVVLPGCLLGCLPVEPPEELVSETLAVATGTAGEVSSLEGLADAVSRPRGRWWFGLVVLLLLLAGAVAGAVVPWKPPPPISSPIGSPVDSAGPSAAHQCRGHGP